MSPEPDGQSAETLDQLLARIGRRAADLQKSAEQLQQLLGQDDVVIIDHDRFMLALQRRWCGPQASWKFPESVEEALSEAAVRSTTR